jgi:hypothetical protein
MQIYNNNSHIAIDFKKKHKMVVGVGCETVYVYFNTSGRTFDFFYIVSRPSPVKQGCLVRNWGLLHSTAFCDHDEQVVKFCLTDSL